MTRPEPASPRRSRARTALAVTTCAVLLGLLALFGASALTESTHELHIPWGGTTALLRSLLFTALCLQLGEFAGERLARTIPDAPGTTPRAWAAPAALAGVLASLGLAVVFAAGDASLTAGLPALHEMSATREGKLALLEANAFLLAALCAWLGRPGWAAVPLAGVILGEALRAHPEQETLPIGVALTLVHLSATVLWAGGLVQVLRTMRIWHGGGHRDAARGLLAVYARYAALLLAALAVTGTVSTLRRLPLDQLLSSAYGRTLLIKLVLVALVSCCALAARRALLRDRLARTRAVHAELVTLAAVLVVSALLTVAPLPVWD
ncbi:CopD family protein [Streptomyces sp. AJS327]|uniref:CopD family protein n=1 Tax=Streptomyces sp. AJS327 TaxID=2545265 RepID=UPI0015DF1C4A|nr:CopD family protein [Streptomyces sp. AJS327]